MTKPRITTAEELAEIRASLSYDKDTGLFTWIKPGKRRRLNSIAGAIRPSGYVGIGFFYRQFHGHRLAWLFSYGELPEGTIDHINGVCHDNRISNLRLCTNQQNSWNKHARMGKSQFKGVATKGAKWQAIIRVEGKSRHLGTFKCEGCAAIAYDNAARKYFGDFARPNF